MRCNCASPERADGCSSPTTSSPSSPRSAADSPRHPTRDELARFLAEPPGLLDPRTDIGALCQILAIDLGELMWFADVQSRERRAAPQLQHYRWRALPKRGGVRLVAAPKPRLKEIQRRLLRRLDAAIPLHDSAHGGVRSRSVASALTPHAGARVLVHLDLESFFPTVTAGRVRGLLRSVRRRSGGRRCDRRAVHDGDAGARVARGAASARHGRHRGAAQAPRASGRATPAAGRADLAVAGERGRVRARPPARGARRSLRRRRTRAMSTISSSAADARCIAARAGFIAAAESIVRDEGFALAAHKTSVRTNAGRLAALGAVVNDHPALPRERTRPIASDRAQLPRARRGRAGRVARAIARTDRCGRRTRPAVRRAAARRLRPDRLAGRGAT